jgi:hypothetical protein
VQGQLDEAVSFYAWHQAQAHDAGFEPTSASVSEIDVRPVHGAPPPLGNLVDATVTSTGGAITGQLVNPPA